MGSDIIDEIERYLSKFRIEETDLKINITSVDSSDAASSGTTASFNKTWCKLGLPEKLNRLMRYLTKVQQKLNLDVSKTEDLRKFFYEHVNTTLASDEYVSYDPVEGNIITIIGLKYENSFYLDSDKAPKPEGIRVKQRVFSNMSQLLNANPTSSSVLEAACSEAAAIDAVPSQVPQKKTVLVIKKKN